MGLGLAVELLCLRLSSLVGTFPFIQCRTTTMTNRFPKRFRALHFSNRPVQGPRAEPNLYASRSAHSDLWDTTSVDAPTGKTVNLECRTWV